MLKGSATIELTDVKTGWKEVHQHDNMVTNAVLDILQMNPDGYLFDANCNLSSTLLPICPNAIGGIMLFSNALAEDPTQYYAPDDNPVVGYSSNNVNSGTDPMRGSMNLTESGALEDGSGYRFVFDFSTSQANGTIAALGLTSDYGGVAGYGSSQNASNPVRKLATKYAKFYTSAKAEWLKIANIVALDQNTNTAYFAHVSAAKTIQVGKARLGQLGLFNNTGPNLQSILETHTITTEAFAPDITSTCTYTAFVDGGDGFIWGFGHANNTAGNSSGVASILWIKISKEDWSYTEGTWSVDKRFHAFGKSYVGTGNTTTQQINTYCIIHKGYLYCVDYWKSSFIKLNLSNPTDLEYIEDPDSSIPIVDMGSGSEFNVVGDVVYFPGGYFLAGAVHGATTTAVTDTNSSDTGAPVALYRVARPGLRYGPFLLGYNLYYYDSDEMMLYRDVYLMTPYLATINNLENPVEKTADKTMKITYILREE